MTHLHFHQGDATVPLGAGAKVICQVCNDVGGWGKGFVVAISRRWPEPEARYREWHAQGEAGGFRLGAMQLVTVGPGLSVANLIAQHGLRPSQGLPPIRYEALRECLATLASEAKALTASVHMPRIGCGLAGGSWPEVEALIDQTLLAADVPVHVYDFEPFANSPT